MIASAKDLLGKGLYTPAEAALYARVRTPLLTRWVFGTPAGDPVFRPEFDPQERTVSFRDLVQTLAVRSIRIDAHLVPLPRIRQAVQLAEETYGIRNPLCQRHVIRVNPHTRDLFIELPNRQIVQATGTAKHNQVMRPILEPFLLDLEFGEDGFAALYRPLKDGDRSIVIDPDRKLGEPFVDPCGYSVWSLRDALAAEGSIERAAAAYGVQVDDVGIAIRYVDSLLTADDPDRVQPR